MLNLTLPQRRALARIGMGSRAESEFTVIDPVIAGLPAQEPADASTDPDVQLVVHAAASLVRQAFPVAANAPAWLRIRVKGALGVSERA